MNLIDARDPILYSRVEDFDFRNPPVDPMKLAEDMIILMEEKRGIGLSANQVGLPYRCFVMANPEEPVIFNPKITYYSEDEMYLEEGCLSFPNLVVKVKRPRFIRARYQDARGEFRTTKFDGISARVFQHEMDHLDGIDFLKRANRYHRDLALKRKKKYDKLAKSA